ncbi:hypothetical protein ACULNC_13785 [Shigella flexneri]
MKVDLNRPMKRSSPSFRNIRFPLVCRSLAPLLWVEYCTRQAERAD